MRELFLTIAASAFPGDKAISHKFNSHCVYSFKLETKLNINETQKIKTGYSMRLHKHHRGDEINM